MSDLVDLSRDQDRGLVSNALYGMNLTAFLIRISTFVIFRSSLYYFSKIFTYIYIVPLKKIHPFSSVDRKNSRPLLSIIRLMASINFAPNLCIVVLRNRAFEQKARLRSFFHPTTPWP